MLDKGETQELINIVDTANDCMDARGIPEYSLLAVQWNDEIDRWEVVYYSDYGIDYTTVFVQQLSRGHYMATGETGGSDWGLGCH